ncbi:hypothetical protein [uncultured Thiodictyon sp.]|uniref:hypothetical protein n=1 Tax=uncultured Thiodictyon sp. TaxID=1846217 RepID=UPI0025ECE927|nr:hypothetical protein [uncultured Thiodictyon sp.]
MSATVLIEDAGFRLLAGAVPVGPARALDAAALGELRSLAARYWSLEQCPDAAAALAIGRAFYHWLDGDQRVLGRLLEQAAPPLILTVHCPARHPGPADWALLEAPWELLADAHGWLAQAPLLQYSPVRRVGPVAEPPPPDGHRLGLAFMAAAPQGASELDYENEEAAILTAVGDTGLDLLVDESGEASALARHLAEVGGLPVLHLSCHGHHAWRDGPASDPRPVLLGHGPLRPAGAARGGRRTGG